MCNFCDFLKIFFQPYIQVKHKAKLMDNHWKRYKIFSNPSDSWFLHWLILKLWVLWAIGIQKLRNIQCSLCIWIIISFTQTCKLDMNNTDNVNLINTLWSNIETPPIDSPHSFKKVTQKIPIHKHYLKKQFWFTKNYVNIPTWNRWRQILCNKLFKFRGWIMRKR